MNEFSNALNPFNISIESISSAVPQKRRFAEAAVPETTRCKRVRQAPSVVGKSREHSERINGEESPSELVLQKRKYTVEVKARWHWPLKKGKRCQSLYLHETSGKEYRYTYEDGFWRCTSKWCHRTIILPQNIVTPRVGKLYLASSTKIHKKHPEKERQREKH